MHLTFDGVSGNRQCLNVTIIDDSDFERDENFFLALQPENIRTGGGANLTRSHTRGVTYIFTVPPESPLRNCSGTVVSLQYCYQARNRDRENNRTVFNILSLTQNGMSFRVNRRIFIRTIPPDSICTSIGNRRQICCDNTTLRNFNRFQLPYMYLVPSRVCKRRPV